MNTNRRQFLKVTLAATVVAAVAPLSMLTPTDKKRYVTFNCGKMPTEEYYFSCYTKRFGEDEWKRFFTPITLEKDMTLIVRADLLIGDRMAYPQIESASKWSEHKLYNRVKDLHRTSQLNTQTTS